MSQATIERLQHEISQKQVAKNSLTKPPLEYSCGGFHTIQVSRQLDRGLCPYPDCFDPSNREPGTSNPVRRNVAEKRLKAKSALDAWSKELEAPEKEIEALEKKLDAEMKELKKKEAGK